MHNLSPGKQNSRDWDATDGGGAMETEMLNSLREEAEREVSPAQDARVSRKSQGEVLWANRAVSGLATGLLDQGQAPHNTAWLRAQSRLGAVQNYKGWSREHSKIAHCGSHKGGYLQGLVVDSNEEAESTSPPRGTA